MIKLQNN